jgi:hypothetical protein
LGEDGQHKSSPAITLKPHGVPDEDGSSPSATRGAAT